MTLRRLLRYLGYRRPINQARLRCRVDPYQPDKEGERNGL